MELDKSLLDNKEELDSYSFYEKYGIADLAFNFSKENDIETNDVLTDTKIQGLIDFYNEEYRFRLMHKFRIEPSFNISEKKVTYSYVGAKIMKNKDYVLKSGNAKKGIYLSTHIISTDSKDCKNLFSKLNVEIKKDGSNSQSLCPFTTKVVNKHKQSYSKFSILQLIGQIITTSSPNKYYYSKNFKNTSFIPRFNELGHYIKLIKHINNSNVNEFLVRNNCDINKDGVFKSKIPIIFDGNFNVNLKYPYNNKFKFIDLYKEVYGNLSGLPSDVEWYEISQGNVKVINISKDILDTTIHTDINFKVFSDELLADKSLNSGYEKSVGFSNKYYKKLFDFYVKFEYKKLYSLINNKEGIRITDGNPIIEKLINKEIDMEIESKEIIKEMMRKLTKKIWRMSIEKNNKLGGSKETMYGYNNSFKRTFKNFIRESSSINDFIFKSIKYLSKYNVGEFVTEETMDYIQETDIDIEEFKKLSTIYLYTKFNKEDKESKTEEPSGDELEAPKL